MVFRSLGLIVAGLVALFIGISRYGEPALPAERGGWLYERFGAQGIVYGEIALGVALLAIGVFLAYRLYRNWR